MPPRKRLGQLLTELGVIDEHQLQSALGHQKQWGGKLGAVLVQKGFCKEPEVVSALSKHLGMPTVRIADAKVDPRAVKFVSRQIAEKLHVFPYEISGSGRSEVVTIAMSDPTDLSAVDQLAFHTGKRIKPMLAGDSEIVRAIVEHYGAAEPAKPAASPGAPAKPAVPTPAPPAATPPSAVSATEFPRRIGPTPTPSAGAARLTPAAGTTPYIPPPIPPVPETPVQKLEEIEPDESIAVPASAPAVPVALDLPEDDGEAMPLEPIAAHAQFGEEVAGQEDVAGDGTAADVVEGLESASVAHEGASEAAQMDGLEPIAAHAQEPSWGGEAQPAAAEPWTAPATGWGEETSVAAAEPSADFGAAQDWSTSDEPTADAAWAGEEAAPATDQPAGDAWGAGGWGEQPPAGTAEAEPAAEGAADGANQDAADASAADASAETPAADAGGEQLPMDAIIGTAEEAPNAPETWAAEAGAEAPAADEPPPPPAEEEFVASSNGAAAPETAPAHEQGIEGAGAPAEETPAEAAPEAAEATDAPDAWGATEDPLAASAESAWGAEPEAPAETAWHEVPGAPDAISAETSPSTDRFAAAETAEAPPSASAETEAPPEWGETETFGGEESPEEPGPDASAAEDVAYETAGAGVEEPAATAAADEAPVAAEEPAVAEDEPAATGDEPAATGDEPAAAEGFASEEAAAEAPPDEGGELKLDGWVAPPPEPEPQGAGWLGQALDATTPLSSADVETLASAGIDPNDGVGALRLLASMVRLLGRKQILDLDELANEVRESLERAAAESGAAQSTGEQPGET